eukprot:CFRG7719T1
MRVIACHILIDVHVASKCTTTKTVLRAVLESCALGFYCFPTKPFLLGASVVHPSGKRMDAVPFAKYTTFLELQELVRRAYCMSDDLGIVNHERDKQLKIEFLETDEIMRQFLSENQNVERKIFAFTTQSTTAVICLLQDALGRSAATASEVHVVHLRDTFGRLDTPDSSESMDVVTIPSTNLQNDEDIIRRFLSPYLNDTQSIDAEHVQLVVDQSEHIVLKCDTVSKVMDFTAFPQISQMLYTGPDGPVFPYTPGAKRVKQQLRNGINRLKIMSFGFPHVLLPTMSSKYEWSSLDKNTSRFTALCRTMSERKIALLLTSRATDNTRVPSAYFMLLPSETDQSLLLKSVASKEIYLHELTLGPPRSMAYPRANEEINAALDQIPRVDHFNPLNLRSCVFDWLITTLSRNGKAKTISARKRKPKTNNNNLDFDDDLYMSPPPKRNIEMRGTNNQGAGSGKKRGAEYSAVVARPTTQRSCIDLRQSRSNPKPLTSDDEDDNCNSS